MIAYFETRAMIALSHDEYKRPATFVINGIEFNSPFPVNAGEAESYNKLTQQIVDLINKSHDSNPSR